MNTDNFRATALMVLAMALFAIEDVFIKGAAIRLPVGELLVIMGGSGAALFALWAALRGQRVVSRAVLRPLVLLRTLAEMGAALGFVASLKLIPLSLAAAILQITPLLVVGGAAVVLGERVGWRRWAAVIVGLAGVLLILRPGFEGFRPAALLALGAAASLALRDIASRRLPDDVPTLQVSFISYASGVPAGLVLLPFEGGWAVPDGGEIALLAGATLFGVTGYAAIVGATRIGEVSFVIPFRYSRLVFALILGAVIFGEHPDALTLTGAAIVVGSGLYAFWRERRLASAGVPV